MNQNSAISSLKLVYTNDLYDIFIKTNNATSVSGHRCRPSFIYFKGEFHSLNGSGMQVCSREQTEFLLSVMTKFGVF